MRFPFFAMPGAYRRYTFSRCPCGLYLMSGVCCALCSTLNKLSNGMMNRVTGRIMKCTDLIPRSAYRKSPGVCRSSCTLCNMSTAAVCCTNTSSTSGRVSPSSSCRRSFSCSRDATPFSCKYGKYSLMQAAASSAFVARTVSAKHT